MLAAAWHVRLRGIALQGKSGGAAAQAIGPWIALGVYCVLRQFSGAVGITDAPPYYQFTFDPIHVATNIVEYADRSMTLGTLRTRRASPRVA